MTPEPVVCGFWFCATGAIYFPDICMRTGADVSIEVRGRNTA